MSDEKVLEVLQGIYAEYKDSDYYDQQEALEIAMKKFQK